MNDKMRAEFEEWAVAEGLTLHGKDGRYLKEIQSAWMAWQASRASLVVELPSDLVEPALPLGHPDKQWPMCWNTAISECRAAIESAGVRVKP